MDGVPWVAEVDCGGRGLCSLGGVGRVSWVGGVVGFNGVSRVGK